MPRLCQTCKNKNLTKKIWKYGNPFKWTISTPVRGKYQKQYEWRKKAKKWLKINFKKTKKVIHMKNKKINSKNLAIWYQNSIAKRTRARATKTTIDRNEGYEAEDITAKVRRITTNKEPISDSAPQIFTERKEGVLAAYNIRTDKWDAAIDAMDYVHKTAIAKRNIVEDKPTQAAAPGGEPPAEK